MPDARIARIADISSQIAKLNGQLAKAIEAARDEDYSWQTIGDAVGTSRQAAYQRFGVIRDEAS